MEKDNKKKNKITFENIVLIIEIIVFFGCIIYGIVKALIFVVIVKKQTSLRPVFLCL